MEHLWVALRVLRHAKMHHAGIFSNQIWSIPYTCLSQKQMPEIASIGAHAISLAYRGMLPGKYGNFDVIAANLKNLKCVRFSMFSYFF